MQDELGKIIKLSDSIIFDFDGVILDSVNIKGDCFYQIYEIYGDKIAKKVINHHMKNGGMSRFDKFKLYHKEYLGVKLDKKGLNLLTDQFKKLSIEKIIKTPEIPGAFKFIKKNYRKKELYICSSAPKNELNYILKKIKLFKFFKGIYGYPETKRNNLINIINKGIKKNYIFIGDSINDYNACKNLDIKFIGLGKNFRKNKTTNFYIENFLIMNTL